jgi:HSP20 family molecular chaperone IbpA
MDPLEARITPAVDIFETPDSFVLHLDMPGAVRELLSVSVEGTRLEVSGRCDRFPEDRTTVRVSEIIKKSYHRIFNLTPGLESGEIEAEFENGVLKIVIPKPEHQKSKTIPIK